MSVQLMCMEAADWQGSADLVLTNPYGPLPRCLYATPMILCQRVGRGALVSEWVGGAALRPIGRYGHNLNHEVWAANFTAHEPFPDLSLVGDEIWKDGSGWFPLDLPLRLLDWYSLLRPDEGSHRLRVWDGFCGRGTVAAACVLLGHDCVSIDRDPRRIAMATDYLGGVPS